MKINKMTQINIFIEHLNDTANNKLDEIKVYNDAVKMTNFIIEQNEIFENSCLKPHKFNTISFDIVFTNNEEIQKINKEYRQKDTPTDVITFAIFADSPLEERFIIDGEINLGEIIVSLDKIETQAKENNKEFIDELYYIISHGILHLLGFDHQSENDYNFMVNWQNKAKAEIL